MRQVIGVLAIFVGLGLVASFVTGEMPKESAPVVLPTIDQSRRQAELLHTTLHATLQGVHHRYYREDEGLQIPAAMLKDVFAELEKEQGVTLRWLAVEGQSMNTDHQARDAFEKQAVEALKAGKGSLELAENGIYRRATAITLGSHCLKCHVPDRKTTTDRVAGLIVAIPVGK